MKNSKKGISLIVLIITIIVIIILATAILVSVISNNPISEANKARYESDRDNMQAVFTNTVGKIMAENQGVVNVTAGQINTVTTDVDEVTGEVAYTVDNATVAANASGKIYFDKGTNDATTYYTGKKLPIYAAGETKWYVDSEGVLSLEVAGVKYGSGVVESGSVSGELDMSTVSATLEENDWETIQKVVNAGKVAEAGWSVGDTKTVTINSQEKEATIIGINHDSENTVTFMIMSSIGKHIMNSASDDYPFGDNIGGWEASEMRAWLNSDIYNSMSNKDYIKEVTKMTNNVGYGGTIATGTQDKVFLLSAIEINLSTNYDINGEGTAYDWFEINPFINGNSWYWLRSPSATTTSNFIRRYCGNYSSGTTSAKDEMDVFPAFVIG